MIHGKAFDVLFRLSAGWDLRARERDQWGPVVMTLALVATLAIAAVGFGGGLPQWLSAVALMLVLVGLYVYGLWEDGEIALAEGED